MATWLDTIDADGDERLTLPPGRHPRQELARYRDFLKAESNRLRDLHRQGTGGREICQGRSRVVDNLLRHLLESVLGQTPGRSDAQGPRLALVAVGGYGRGELSPYSDIDILFLHNVENATVSRGPDRAWLAAVTDGLLYPLWDIGLKLGHSVRTVEDCVTVANVDMQSKTSLIEARCVGGDVALFERFQSVLLAKCVRGYEDQYIAARIEDQEARRARHGGSACMQEPNLKNGCGGLRDYQNLLWMAFFKYRTRTLEELEREGLVSESERCDLQVAYDFLLRVRNELHYETHRATDVLARSLQPRVAANLGHAARSPVRRIELFMRRVYRHLRQIYLFSRTLEQRLALLPPTARRLPSFRDLLRRGRWRAREQAIDGFRIVDGVLQAGSKQVFRDDPRRLLRVFLHAQRGGLSLDPDLVQMLRREAHVVDRAFRRDPEVCDTFLEILNQRGSVGPILRAMHEVELLGRYLPEFGRLTCLVQHEFYHQYTADEHTLACIEHLDRVATSDEPPYNRYTDLFQSLDRPFVLYLALLLHDVGKAHRTGRHSETGARAALVVSRRLGLDGATAHALRLVIEHHLLMAMVSQRRDLDDPAVIRQFAGHVQSVENLNLLTLHTLADSLGTSDRLWNGFKDTLLTQLHQRANAVLEGADDFQEAAEQERLRLLDQLRRQVPAPLATEELEAHFEHLPDRYFRIHTIDDILEDLHLVHDFLRRRLDDHIHPLAPVIRARTEPARGCTVIKVCTWNRHGFFQLISGALTAVGLNILSAQVFTRTDGILLDTFGVTEARTGLPASPEANAEFASLLERALTDGVELEPLIARRRPTPVQTRLPDEERIPTSIEFDNESSDSQTVLDLETEDHVGLLHTVARALAELDIDMALARVTTEKGAAIDSFYVLDRDGQKITSPQRQAEIRHALTEAIQRLDSRA